MQDLLILYFNHCLIIVAKRLEASEKKTLHGINTLKTNKLLTFL